jgi:integrase
MANRKVQLYIYCKLQSGWRYCAAAYYANGTIKHWVAVTPDGEKKFPGAKYYLYTARKWEMVGSDPAEAVRATEKRQGETLIAAATTADEQQPLTLARAFDQWLEDVKAAGAADNTVQAKGRIARDFKAHCGDIRLDQLTRMQCLNWINTVLVAQGNEDRTRNVKANRLNQFLQFHNLKLIAPKDIPTYTVGEVQQFTAEELNRFWQACRPEQVLMCKVLLCCGLRRKEIASLRWKDIDFDAGLIHIQPRPEYGFIPKKKHCRQVATPDGILSELRAAQQQSKSLLCFPTRNDQPNNKIWEFINRTCKRAGIDAGKAHPHVFRSTYCTTLLRGGMELQDVAQLLGHKDISTTQRYMAVMSNQELRTEVNKIQFAL